MVEEGEIKTLIYLPCSQCKALNKITATFKTEATKEETPGEQKSIKEMEMEKDADKRTDKPKGESVRPDSKKGSTPTNSSPDK